MRHGSCKRIHFVSCIVENDNSVFAELNRDQHIFQGHLIFKFHKAFLHRWDKVGGVKPPEGVFRNCTNVHHYRATLLNFSCDCECFTRSSLSISKNGPVISSKTIINNSFGNFCKNLILICIFLKNMIEFESMKF